jgi:hypothetical protein
VSLTKLMVMCTVTGGTYAFYWYYALWRAERERTRDVPHPLLLALFGPLSSFGLFNRIRLRARATGVPCGYSPGILFFLVTLTLVVKLPGLAAVAVGTVTAVPLIPVQAVALRINRAVDPTAAPAPIVTRVDILLLLFSALTAAAALAARR